MSTIISAHFDGRHFVPDEPVTGMAPGDRVRVLAEATPTPPAKPGSDDDPLMRMLDFAVDMGIPDLAENADHYLYGHPKQSNQADAQ